MAPYSFEDDFDLEQFGKPKAVEPKTKEPKTKEPKAAEPKAAEPKGWSTDDDRKIPPHVDYINLYNELSTYNFSMDRGADISDIIVYFETIQKNRSRVIELEQEAERNYSSIELTYDILSAEELLKRPEKTAKEKEAAVLVQLRKWAEATKDAKMYAATCKKYREQIDATHHLLSKILNAKQLEVQIKAYQGKSTQSGPSRSFEPLSWTD